MANSYFCGSYRGKTVSVCMCVCVCVCVGEAFWPHILNRVNTKDNVHSSTDGYKTLVKNILGFREKGKLDFHFQGISNASSDLLSILTTSKVVYHHSCFSKHSNSKLKDFDKTSKKQKSTEDENGRKLTRFSVELRKILNLFCCCCS